MIWLSLGYSRLEDIYCTIYNLKFTCHIAFDVNLNEMLVGGGGGGGHCSSAGRGRSEQTYPALLFNVHSHLHKPVSVISNCPFMLDQTWSGQFVHKEMFESGSKFVTFIIFQTWD